MENSELNRRIMQAFKDAEEARPGPGRTRRVEFRIPGAVLDRLDAIAERDGIGRSRALLAAVLRWLDVEEDAG